MTLTIACMLSLILAINIFGVYMGDRPLANNLYIMFGGCTLIAWIAACVVRDLKGKSW